MREFTNNIVGTNAINFAIRSFDAERYSSDHSGFVRAFRFQMTRGSVRIKFRFLYGLRCAASPTKWYNSVVLQLITRGLIGPVCFSRARWFHELFDNIFRHPWIRHWKNAWRNLREWMPSMRHDMYYMLWQWLKNLGNWQFQILGLGPIGQMASLKVN